MAPAVVHTLWSDLPQLLARLVRSATGLGGAFCSFLVWRILPFVVVFVAACIGWLHRDANPEGVFVSIVTPLQEGKLPPLLFEWKTPGTPEVPADFLPQPRPQGELFLNLPGGDKLPAVGIGMCCRGTAYHPESVRRTVMWYLLQGGRHIDTAQLYLNHRSIGQGIRDAMARGVPRSEIFVTTKIFPRHYGENSTLKVVPTFLEELGLEYIDMVLMHSPYKIFGLPWMTPCGSDGLSPKDCRAATWRALSQLRDQGVMRNIGVSNFNLRQMQELQDLGLAPVALNQFQYNPWALGHRQEIFQYCNQQGIAVTAWGSLAGTFIKDFEPLTQKTLKEIAAVHEKTVAQVLLRWALQKNASIIPGTGNPKHMRENLAVYDFELSAQDMANIDALSSDPQAKKFFHEDRDET